MDVANVLSTTFTLEGGKAWYDALHASLAACSLPEEVREVESRFLAEYKAAYQQDYIKNACKLKIIRLENPNVPGVELVTALNPEAFKPVKPELPFGIPPEVGPIFKPGAWVAWKLGLTGEDKYPQFLEAINQPEAAKEAREEEAASGEDSGLKWYHVLLIGAALAAALFLIIKLVF